MQFGVPYQSCVYKKMVDFVDLWGNELKVINRF